MFSRLFCCLFEMIGAILLFNLIEASALQRMIIGTVQGKVSFVVKAVKEHTVTAILFKQQFRQMLPGTIDTTGFAFRHTHRVFALMEAGPEHQKLPVLVYQPGAVCNNADAAPWMDILRPAAAACPEQNRGLAVSSGQIFLQRHHCYLTVAHLQPFMAGCGMADVMLL